MGDRKPTTATSLEIFKQEVLQIMQEAAKDRKIGKFPPPVRRGTTPSLHLWAKILLELLQRPITVKRKSGKTVKLFTDALSWCLTLRLEDGTFISLCVIPYCYKPAVTTSVTLSYCEESSHCTSESRSSLYLFIVAHQWLIFNNKPENKDSWEEFLPEINGERTYEIGNVSLIIYRKEQSCRFKVPGSVQSDFCRYPWCFVRSPSLKNGFCDLHYTAPEVPQNGSQN